MAVLRTLSQARCISTVAKIASLHPAARLASVAPTRRTGVCGFATFPDHVKLLMPALSPTMEKGNIAQWKKKEGDKIKPGDVICEVETDKAVVAFESTEEGYLAKILVPEGSKDVALGALLGVLVDEASLVPAFKNFSAEGAPQAAAPAAPKPAAAAPTPTPTPAAPASVAPAAAAPAAPTGDRVSASPLARKVAAERGIDLSSVRGTGPGRRIVRADVDEFKQTAPAAAAAVPGATGDYKDVPNSNIRKVIAKRLTESKQTIPHYYLTVDIAMNNILKLRSELNAKLGDGGKLSVNDFIVKASALALRKVPTANNSWLGDAIREYNYVDICVAVTTDAGLITPIVADADLKGLAAISGEVKSLASKARAGKLQPHEYQGGTFTISNLGMFGVKQFTAVINPPQSCILAVGASEQRVIVNPAAKQGDANQYTTANFMTVTLSCDHRVVDGAVGAQWLQAFKGFMEEPSTMLL